MKISILLPQCTNNIQWNRKTQQSSYEQFFIIPILYMVVVVLTTFTENNTISRYKVHIYSMIIIIIKQKYICAQPK